MNRIEKSAVIDELVEKFDQYSFFYITDSSKMTVEQVNNLRRKCFEENIEFKVIKNTLIEKALERSEETKGGGYTKIVPALKGSSALMFCEQSNHAAKLIKAFRANGGERPVLKAAYIDSDVFFGDDQLDVLTKLKSKEDLLGELIGLLQSPMSNVLGALQSGGNNIAGLLKALEERG